MPILALAACHGRNDAGNAVPGDRDDHQPWGEIAVAERIRVTGTEPYWNAEVRDGLITYRTPERPAGDQATVTRFAGRGGVSFSGTLGGHEFTLAIGPGPCSDGMSDRHYPYNALLKIGGEVRKGCGWSDRRPAKEVMGNGATRSATQSAAESGIVETYGAMGTGEPDPASPTP
ncbi:hypothetical protein WBP06_13450 [Novosphingobium sp. BL-8H]|uniref:COG3650 family protein n=1 Tax=Novosphingobium sp. BL-8H TaxID=3127640 RepID=UPI003756F849